MIARVGTRELAVHPPAVIPPGRSWLLGIIGIRVEAGAFFVRSNVTGGSPKRLYLTATTHATIAWDDAAALALAPRPAHGGLHLAMAAGARLLGETAAGSPADHAYANVFAKWEPAPHTRAPVLVECGYELTAFAPPRPGVKHARVVLAAHRPDDPARPAAIHITLSLT